MAGQDEVEAQPVHKQDAAQRGLVSHDDLDIQKVSPHVKMLSAASSTVPISDGLCLC